jgi:hypothetical protein
MSSSFNLLRRLQPAVPPGHPESERVRRQPASPIERQSFDQLLTLVSDGRLESGRPLEIGFVPEPAWDEGASRRLASAADLAEAHGAQRAVLVMDGRGFLLDVVGRQLTEELTTGEARVLNVDAAVQVASASEATPLPKGPFAVPPAAVSEQLSRRHVG